MEIPEGLSKKEIEFWAWLTESHILPDPLEFNSSKKNPSSRLVSTEELRHLIARAFDENDSHLADKLLEIASQQQIMSDEIIRKSRRIKPAEYLKLLYIKRDEATSFSDVIVKLVTPYAKKYLKELKIKWKNRITQNSNKMEHLFNLIESWSEMSPETRSRAVDMGIFDFEGKKNIPLDYPYKYDILKTFLPDYYLSELNRKFIFDEESVHIKRSRVYEYFERKWKSELYEYPIGDLSLEVIPDKNNKNKLIFQPIVRLNSHLYNEQILELSEKYGERDVVGFINLFEVSSDGEENINFMGSLGEKEYQRIFMHTDIKLPGCIVTINDSEDYKIDYEEDTVFIENLYQDFRILMEKVKELSKKVEINDSKFFEIDNQRLKIHSEKASNKVYSLHNFLRSDSWSDFLKTVTRLANPEDFITIKKINEYRNRILNYFKVESFIYDLIESSITRRSVVSFYVSKDVWRFLPLVLKEHNWYDMAESYLANQ